MLPVNQLMVSLPDDGSVVTAAGLGGGKTMDTRDGSKLRIYAASKVKAGAKMSLAIKWVGSAAGSSQSDQSVADDGQSPRGAKAIVGIGAGVLAACAGVIFLRSSRKRKLADAEQS